MVDAGTICIEALARGCLAQSDVLRALVILLPANAGVDVLNFAAGLQKILNLLVDGFGSFH